MQPVCGGLMTQFTRLQQETVNKIEKKKNLTAAQNLAQLFRLF